MDFSSGDKVKLVVASTGIKPTRSPQKELANKFYTINEVDLRKKFVTLEGVTDIQFTLRGIPRLKNELWTWETRTLKNGITERYQKPPIWSGLKLIKT